jgi:hypothetical protein
LLFPLICDKLVTKLLELSYLCYDFLKIVGAEEEFILKAAKILAPVLAVLLAFALCVCAVPTIRVQAAAPQTAQTEEAPAAQGMAGFAAVVLSGALTGLVLLIRGRSGGQTSLPVDLGACYKDDPVDWVH